MSDGATFYFDTNIEDTVNRIVSGLGAIAGETAKSHGGKVKSPLEGLAPAVAQEIQKAKRQVGELNELFKTNNIDKGTLTRKYQEIVSGLSAAIGKLGKNQKIDLDVVLDYNHQVVRKFAEVIKNEVTSALQHVDLSPALKARVGTGRVQANKEDVRDGYGPTTAAANKGTATAAKNRQTSAESSATSAATTAAADKSIADSAEETAKHRRRQTRAAKKAADRAEQAAEQQPVQPAAPKAPAQPSRPPAPTAPAAGNATALHPGVQAQLDKLARQLSRGLITQEEHDRSAHPVRAGLEDPDDRTYTPPKPPAATPTPAAETNRERLLREKAENRAEGFRIAEERKAAHTQAGPHLTRDDVAARLTPTALARLGQTLQAADTGKDFGKVKTDLSRLGDLFGFAGSTRSPLAPPPGHAANSFVNPIDYQNIPGVERARSRTDASGIVHQNSRDLDRINNRVQAELEAIERELEEQERATGLSAAEAARVAATLKNTPGKAQKVNNELDDLGEAVGEATGHQKQKNKQAPKAAAPPPPPPPNKPPPPPPSPDPEPEPEPGKKKRKKKRPAPDEEKPLDLGDIFGGHDKGFGHSESLYEPADADQQKKTFKKLTKGVTREGDFASGIERISNSRFVADLRKEVTQIYLQVDEGFIKLKQGTTLFAAQMGLIREQMQREINRLKAQAAGAARATQVRGNLESRAQSEDRARSNKRDLAGEDGDFAQGVESIGGPASRYVADTRGAQTRIFRRVKEGFEEIEKGSADFEAQVRRLRAQQTAQNRPGIIGSFGQGFAQGGLFGQGGKGGGISGALEGVARSAGLSSKYAIIGQALYGIQSAAASAGQEVLDFADSYTELNVALQGAGIEGADDNIKVTQQTINSLADSATLAGANVGQAMDLAASAIRAFGSDAGGTQADVERLGRSFAAEASKIATLTKTDIADASGNLKAAGLAFDIPVENLSRVTDAIVGAKQIGGGNEKDLSQAGASAAVAAKEAGFSIEETYSLLSKIVAETDEGGQLAANRFSKITAIIGGSAGKSAITKLNDTLAESQKVDISADVKTQVQQLAAVYKDLDKAQQQQLINSLGGTANARELIILLSSANELISKADQGFTGKGAEEYKKRLEDIRAQITKIQGELKQITVALSQSGVLDPFLALVKFGLVPALDATRKLLQFFNLIPRPIRDAGFAIAEIAVALKLIQSITRAGGLSNFFRGAEGAVAPVRAEARAARAARKADAAARATDALDDVDVVAGASIKDTAGLRKRDRKRLRKARLAELFPDEPVAPQRRRSITGLDSRDLFAPVRTATGKFNAAYTKAVYDFSDASKGARQDAIKRLRDTAEGSKDYDKNQRVADLLETPAQQRRETRRQENETRNTARENERSRASQARRIRNEGLRDSFRQTLSPFDSSLISPSDFKRKDAEFAARRAGRQTELDALGPRRPTAGRLRAEAFGDRVKQSLSAFDSSLISPSDFARNNAEYAERQAARQAQLAGLRRTPRPGIGDRIAAAKTNVQGKFGALGFGQFAPTPEEEAARGRKTFGTKLKGIGEAIGPEAAIAGAALSISASIEASHKIDDAVKEFDKLRDLKPNSFGVDELRASAANLEAGAHSLNDASSGIFGTIVNFARGNETGARAKALKAQADFERIQADAVEAEQKKARLGAGSTLANTIDVSSADTLSASIEGLSGAGRSATTQFQALLGAMDNLGDGANRTASSLTSLDKTKIAAGAGDRFFNDLTNLQDDSTFKNTRAGALAGKSYLGGLVNGGDLGAAQDAASSYEFLGLNRYLGRQDNAVGRFVRKRSFLGFGAKDAETNFQLGKVDKTKASQGVTDVTKQFLSEGGDISTEQGAADLKALYVTSLTKSLPKIPPGKIQELAAQALEEAKASLRQLTSIKDPTATLQEILTQGKQLAQDSASEQGVQAALGRNDPKGQGSQLVSANLYLQGLKDQRAAAVAAGAKTPELEKIDADIDAASVAQRQAAAGRQSGRDALAQARLPESAKAQASLNAANDILKKGGYDPVTGKRKQKTVKVLTPHFTFNPVTGKREVVHNDLGLTQQEDVGTGLDANDRDAALAAAAEGRKAVAQQKVNNRISKRRLGIDPQDEVGNAKADVQDAKDQVAFLKAQGESGQALTDAQLNVKKTQQAYAKEQVEGAIAARNVNAIPASSLDTAKRNLADTKLRLSVLTKGTVEYNTALAQVVQGQVELAAAADEVKSINRQLSLDLTDPVAVANENVQTAKDALVRAQNQTKDSKGKPIDPDAKAQLVGTAQINLRNAQAQAETAAFGEFLSNAQTANQLGRITSQQYISMLKNRADSLSAEIATLKKGSPMYALLVKERDQALLAVKAAGDELSGVFNIGDIKTPTPYEVRKAIKDKDFGTILGANPSTSTAGNVSTDNSTKTITLNGVPVEQILTMIQDLFGVKARTRASRKA